ncbi:MAG TPA: hypothetical protein PKA06_07570, partial [Gemmatales bacterium]|nr:hypothetical protein [Gemmatales bacterium]
MPKVLLLYNEPRLASNHPDAESERDLLHTVEAVQKALLQFRHEVQRCGVRFSPEELLQGLNRYQPDVVVNLFGG